jgi:acetoin utilization deacetylase AcuC-like enzyme
MIQNAWAAGARYLRLSCALASYSSGRHGGALARSNAAPAKNPAMPLPLIYHDDYSPAFPAEHRFPMDKFSLLRDHLVASGLTRDSDLLRPELCPADVLALAHDRAYIERYMSGQLAREDQRRLGLPWSEDLARRTVRAVGGSLLTAEKALQHGLACHLAGGTHHAHFDYPAGFCIFNDLAVISQYLLASGRVDRVLIFDCDVHQGDGTARMLEGVDAAVTVSLHCEKNFPARKARSDWDIPLPMGMQDTDYLRVVDETLDYLLPLYRPDLVLYDAGVDVHKDDALGYLKLTDAGVAARDEAVIRHCLRRDIPVMGVIGGGYSKDRVALAARHGILHHSAQRLWIEFGLR